MMSEYKILPIDESFYNIPSLSPIQINIDNNQNFDYYYKLLDYLASTLNSVDSLYSYLNNNSDSDLNFEKSQISTSKIIYQQLFSKIQNKICSLQVSVPSSSSSPNNLPINPSRYVVKVQAKKIKSEPYPTNSNNNFSENNINNHTNYNSNPTILSPKVNKPKLNLTKLDLSNTQCTIQQAVPSTPTNSHNISNDRSLPTLYTPSITPIMTPTIAPIAPFTPKYFSSSPLSPTTQNSIYSNKPTISSMPTYDNNSLYYLSSAATLSSLSPLSYYPCKDGYFMPSPFELDYNPLQSTKSQYIQNNIDWNSSNVNDFNFLSKIGSGSFGTAILSRHKSSGIYLCTKLIIKSKIQHQKQREHLMNEKSVMMSLSHPFIVPLYATFNTRDYLLFMMEYVSKGDLFTFTRRFKENLPEQTIKTIIAETILAIEYLHSNNIVYRDLKPENILIDEQGHIKLTDFGFAKKLGFQKTTSSVCGSIDYIAPEIVNINNFYFQQRNNQQQNKNNGNNKNNHLNNNMEPPKGYGKEVDWWSLGILVYELVRKISPFDSESKFNITFPKNSQYSQQLEDFVYKLLVVNPENRLGYGINGSNDIKSHPWFSNINWSQIESKSTLGPFYNFEVFQNLHNDSTKFVVPIDDQLIFDQVDDEFNDFNSK